MTNWLKEIEEREAKATPKPWVFNSGGNSYGAWFAIKEEGSPSWENIAVSTEKTEAQAEKVRRDYEFIAHARTDISTLLEACNAYRKAIKEAPHEEVCHRFGFQFTPRHLIPDGPPPCTCWKSKALSYNPTEVI
jgi:hypothetical protein